MKVNKALETYWHRQQMFEMKLEKESMRKREILKKAAKQEIELMLYEKHVRKLQLAKSPKLGCNVDSLA